MKIVHSISVKFAADGIGYIAYQRVREVYKRGFLKKVIASSFAPSQIDKSLCLELPLSRISTKILSRFTSLSRHYLIRDKVFDWSASFNIPDADIFHGWTSQALLSMRKAKAKGQITFLERPSSHPLTMKQIVDEEYKRNSVELYSVDPILLKTQLRECEKADFVIVPSKFAYQSFLKHGFNPSKLILIPFGVDNEKFQPQPRPDSNNTFRVVFVGQIGMRKGVQYLLQAFSELKLKDAELILTGWFHPDIVEFLRKYQDFSNIKIQDYTYDTPPLYHPASICVFPSIEDGYALVVLEAMACGKPVIITENTGAKDVVSDGEDGFIIPIRSVESLKEKIMYFYENEGKAEEMGRAARKKACQHTWEKCAGELISAYKNSLA